MDAEACSLATLLEGPVQFRVPIYQRHYEWRAYEDHTLAEVPPFLEDIERFCLNDTEHFIGPITTYSTAQKDVPRIFEIIDGQQRLLTVILLLALLRKEALAWNQNQAAAEIEKYLFNTDFSREFKLKVLPGLRNGDRNFIESLLLSLSVERNNESRLTEAYHEVSKLISRLSNEAQDDFEPNEIANQVLSKLKIVNIILSENDNPALVFQRLNSKGRRLTNSDLSRNLVFLRLPNKSRPRVLETLWEPIEATLQKIDGTFEEVFDEFLWVFLKSRKPHLVRRDTLRMLEQELAQSTTIEELLHDANLSTRDYLAIRNPSLIADPILRSVLQGLSTFQVEQIHPTLLALFRARRTGSPPHLTHLELRKALQLMESWLVRQLICPKPAAGLTELLLRPIELALQSQPVDFFENFCLSFADSGFPGDEEFRSALLEKPIYSPKIARKLVWLLHRIEASNKNTQPTALGKVDELCIDHIIPMSISPMHEMNWQLALGPDWRRIHKEWRNRLGNLTIIASKTNQFTLSNIWLFL